ncbi:hypothetical protein SC499_20205 [Peribacillus simplex]|uniref:hypothetical protein n=1 Tax=Peribacillus simplex TaxID=1478 RepID=UPI00298E9256|nr:hypothetical protein [Peribacillus simplex]MDW7616973.1 hypothetical protein [Peribacillus simplex]
MNEALRISRAQRNLEFGMLINRIVEHPGKISKPVIRQLAKYKRQFEASANDKVLGEVIRASLKVLAEVELYVKARNAGDEIAEKRHLNESIRLWGESDLIANRIAEELS